MHQAGGALLLCNGCLVHFFIFLFALLYLIMTGCAVSNTPEAVALEFMEALHSADFEEAMKYCSKDSKEIIKKQIAFLEDMEKKGRFDKSEITEPKVSLISSEIAEDEESAVVRVKVENSSMSMKREGEALEVRVDMVKEDGKWLAEYNGK